MAAAVLAAGPGARASHRSAALLWGVPRPGHDPIDVTVIPGRHPRLGEKRRIVVHRPTDHVDLRRIRRNGIDCTNIVRNLCDLGAVDPGGVEDAVGHALACRFVTLRSMQAAADRHARPGRRGIRALRAALETWTIQDRPADSLLESAMARLVARHRLPAVEFHPVIDGYEVDFRIVDTPIILECDGWRYHGLDKRGFERDRSRDVDLTALGWIIVRFTYRAVVIAPEATARRLRRNVDRWGATPPPDAER